MKPWQIWIRINFGSWIWIRIRVKSWIRIRIKVKIQKLQRLKIIKGKDSDLALEEVATPDASSPSCLRFGTSAFSYETENKNFH
jgi:hypothetical protein